MSENATNGQLILLDAESDEALLVPAAELRKRYTARQVEKIEARLDCIVTMLAWGVPDDHIARAAHVSHHTLTAIGSKHAERIGENAATLADYAQRLSARCAYVAAKKVDAASGKDAAIMHGIFRDSAINLRAAGGGSQESDEALEVQVVDQKTAAARKWLESRNGNAKQLVEVIA